VLLRISSQCKSVQIRGRRHKAGDLVSVDADQAAFMIAQRIASKATDSKAKVRMAGVRRVEVATGKGVSRATPKAKRPGNAAMLAKIAKASA
jgi:hypothetical protein